jgi:hypothetical protein
MGNDVGELEEKQSRAAFELERLRGEMEREKENLRIREKLKNLEHSSLYPLPQLLYMVKENIAKSDDSCGLSVDELTDLERLLDSVGSLACETLIVVREELDRLKKKGGLRLVR